MTKSPRLTQIGRFPSSRINITVANGAIGIRYIMDSQLRLQHATLAAQIFRLLDNAANGRTWAYVFCRLGTEGQTSEVDNERGNREQEVVTWFLHKGESSWGSEGLNAICSDRV